MFQSPDLVLLQALEQVRQVELPDLGRDENILLPQRLGRLQALVRLCSSDLCLSKAAAQSCTCKQAPVCSALSLQHH